jgi:hypothetical protein
MRRRLGLALLGALFLAMLATIAVLYVQASRPLYYEGEEPLVRRATKAAATEFSTTEAEIKRITFPMTMRVYRETCVELRPKRDDLGGYLACYPDGGGEAKYVRVRGTPLGGRKLFPPLW